MVNRLIIVEPDYLHLKDALMQYPSATIVCETDAVCAFINSAFSKNSIHYRDLISIPTPLKAASPLDLAVITILSIQEKAPLLITKASVAHKYIMHFYNDYALEWPPQSIDIDRRYPNWLAILLETHINNMTKASLIPPRFSNQGRHLNLLSSDIDVIWVSSSNSNTNAIESFTKPCSRLMPRGILNEPREPILKIFNTEVEELNYIKSLSADKEFIIVSNDETFKRIYKSYTRISSKRSKIINLILDHILKVGGTARIDQTFDAVLEEVRLLSEMHRNKADFISMIQMHLSICDQVLCDSIALSDELLGSLNKVHVNDYRSAVAFISSALEEHDLPLVSLLDALNLPAKSFVIQGANQENWRMYKDISRDLKLLIKKANVVFTRVINARDSLYEEAEFLNQFEITKDIIKSPYIKKTNRCKPNPTPPLNTRPLAISPTAMEILIRNPYAYYAKYILRLHEKKNKIEFFKEFGKIVHSVIDEMQRIEDFSLFDQVYKAECEKAINQSRLDKRDQAAVLQRLENLRLRIFSFLKNWAKGSLKREIESVKSKDCQLCNGNIITIKAIPDRVDYMEDGSIRITDYKTGFIPSQQEVNHGYYPQLPLEGLIYNDTSSLFYVGVSGMIDKFDVKKISCNYENVLLSIRSLMEMFLSSQSSGYFASTSEDSKTKGYNHLSRLEEWKHNNENINRSSDSDNT